MRITIYCDGAGIDKLIEALKIVRKQPDHIHLCSPKAGGDVLSDLTPWNHPAVCEVIIDSGGDDLGEP